MQLLFGSIFSSWGLVPQMMARSRSMGTTIYIYFFYIKFFVKLIHKPIKRHYSTPCDFVCFNQFPQNWIPFLSQVNWNLMFFLNMTLPFLLFPLSTVRKRTRSLWLWSAPPTGWPRRCSEGRSIMRRYWRITFPRWPSGRGLLQEFKVHSGHDDSRSNKTEAVK